MGANGKNFEGCRAVVSDKKTRKTISDTKIIAYDTSRNVIRIQEDLFQKMEDIDKVTVLILGNQGLYEFAGTVRKAAASGETEIALYAGKEKESRGYVRYEMQSKGKVESVFLGEQEIKLRRMIVVQILNISANGIFFLATAGSFEVGEKIRLQVDLKGNVFASDYKVIRVQKYKNGAWGFGCKNLVTSKGKKESDKQEEREFESETWVTEALEGRASYQTLQETMEERSGYKELLEMTTQFLKNPQAVDESWVNLVQEILQKYKNMTKEVIFNCLYCERPGEEEESRHFLNVLLLCVLFGDYLKYKIKETIDLMRCYIKMQLLPKKQPEEPIEEKEKENKDLVLFLDDYDRKIAAYEKEHTGIPLAFLVQKCYEKDNDEENKSKAIFAKKMLKQVMHKQVLLSDGTLCTLEYLLLNDLSHSIILENGIGKRIPDSVEPAWFIPQKKKTETQMEQSTTEPETEAAQESAAGAVASEGTGTVG